MAKLLQFKNKATTNIKSQKAGDTGELFLYGPVGSSMWEDGIDIKNVAQALKDLGSVKNITIHLNSVGGNVFDGIAIYNLLKRSPAKKTVIVEGLAASIASIIMLAGDEIIIGEGAYVMIHKPFCMTVGNSTELEAVINRLDDVENQMISIYAKKTGLSRSELVDMLARETWMTDQEAIDMGFANSKSEDTIKIAASILTDCKWFKRAPAISNTVEREAKERAEELKSKIREVLARK